MTITSKSTSLRVAATLLVGNCMVQRTHFLTFQNNVYCHFVDTPAYSWMLLATPGYSWILLDTSVEFDGICMFISSFPGQLFCRWPACNYHTPINTHICDTTYCQQQSEQAVVINGMKSPPPRLKLSGLFVCTLVNIQVKDSIRFSYHGNFCCVNYTQGMCTGSCSRQGGAGRHSHYRNTRPQRLTAYYTDWHCSLQQWSETHSSIATHDSTIIQLSSACIIHLILVLPAHRLKNYFLLPLTTYTGTYI